MNHDAGTFNHLRHQSKIEGSKEELLHIWVPAGQVEVPRGWLLGRILPHAAKALASCI